MIKLKNDLSEVPPIHKPQPTINHNYNLQSDAERIVLEVRMHACTWSQLLQSHFSLPFLHLFGVTHHVLYTISTSSSFVVYLHLLHYLLYHMLLFCTNKNNKNLLVKSSIPHSGKLNIIFTAAFIFVKFSFKDSGQK